MEENQSAKFSCLLFLFIILFIFCIHVAILFASIRDYKMHTEEISLLQSDIQTLSNQKKRNRLFYFLPNQHPVVLMEESSSIRMQELNKDGSDIIQEQILDSDPFHHMIVAYQKDGLAIVTKGASVLEGNNHVNFYYYESGQPLKKLDSQPFFIETYLDQSAKVFNNEIYLVGKDEKEDFIASSMINLTIQMHRLADETGLQQVISSKLQNNSVISNLVPMIEIQLYDFDLQTVKNQPFPVAKEHRSDNKNMVQHYVHGPVVAIVMNNQFVQYDLLNDEIIQPIEMPEPLYDPKAFSLPDYTVVIGKSSPTKSSEVIGFITNPSGQNVQPLLIEKGKFLQSYDEKTFNVTQMGKQLYLASETGAGVLDLVTNEFISYSEKQYDELLLSPILKKETELTHLHEEDDGLSIQKFFHFILNDSAGKGVVLSFSIFMAFPFLLVIISLVVHHHKEANMKKAYRHGGKKQIATIENIDRTRITANDDSQVNLTIVFAHQNEMIKKEVKMYADILYPPQIGDTVQILYDPILDKVFLLKETK